MSNYRVFPIFWGQPFPPDPNNNWPGQIPYSGQQFADALTEIVASGYFAELSQYGAGAIGINAPVFSNQPWPPGQGKYVAVFDNNGVVNFIEANFRLGLPMPSQVADGKLIYLVVLPAGSLLDIAALGAHSTFQFQGQSVIWAWMYANFSLNPAILTGTHEIVEAVGADGSAPKELCDDCATANPNGVAGISGLTVAPYFDQLNASCIAPPFFPTTAPFLKNKGLLAETSPASPSLASLGNNLYIAWRGDGNNTLNVESISNRGSDLSKFTSTELSTEGPALCSHNGKLFIAWKGANNDFLSVASVEIAGGRIVGFLNKVILGETSPQRPALCSYDGKLYIAWKGDGNDFLSVMSSIDGKTFGNKSVSRETSPLAPALCSHGGLLYMAWKGDGNDFLSVMSSIDGTTFGSKFVSNETSPQPPALCSQGGVLYIAWKGDGNNHLRVMSSANNGLSFGNKYISTESSPLSPSLCSSSDGVFIGWKGDGNDTLSVAQVNAS